MRLPTPLRKSLSLLIAGYFLLAGLFPGTDLRQLNLLPNLVRHYHAHLDLMGEAPSAGAFWGFVWEHIVDPAGHEDLPGHSHAGLPYQVLQPAVHLYFVSLLGVPALLDTPHFRIEFPSWHWADRDFRRSVFHPPSRV